MKKVLKYMAFMCAAAIAVTAASISVRKINCTVVSGQAHFCTLPTVIIDAGHGGLPNTTDYVKMLP